VLIPDASWTADEWKKYMEQGDEGKCEAVDSDQQIQDAVDRCKNDKDYCKAWIENPCKAAWKADDKYVEAACFQDRCDRICKNNRFSWCGLSAGAIAGIVIACVVVVGAIVGAVVYFVVIRPKKAQVAATT
jgi:hypothetical protein